MLHLDVTKSVSCTGADFVKPLYRKLTYLFIQNNVFAERAFDEFHYYISSAREDIIQNFGTGILFDIHGHGPNPDGFVDLRTWIGYLLSGNELDQNDKDLDFDI